MVNNKPVNGKPAEGTLITPDNAHPGSNSATLARRRLGPAIILAWLMLLYTGIVGHFPEAQKFLTPQPGIFPWFKLAHWPPGITAQLPESHSLCLFRQLIGLPCVFCGVTRSFILLSLGQWQSSLRYHLLGIPFYLSTLFLAIFGILRPQNTWSILAHLLDKRVVAAILTLLFACWLWKLGQNPVFW